MRTKQLMMAALALPLAFAACTNEEIVENNIPQLGSEKVVGAKLIANGASINLIEDAQSRITNGGFDGNDKLGLAWFNNPVEKNGTILGTQNSEAFTWATNHIYNNYLAQKNEAGDFAINGEIYAGAYFVYYPYKKVGQGSQLKFECSKKQDATLLTDRQTKDEHMSKSLNLSQRMILTGEEADENFKLNIQAAPANTMNAFVVRPILVKEGTAYEEVKDLLSGVKITKVTIQTNEAVFATTATVNPLKLSEAQFRDGKFNADDTRASVDKAVLEDGALEYGEHVKSISTEVGYANNLAEDQLSDILVYTFATKEPTKALTSSKTIVIIETNVGKFTYEHPNLLAALNKAVDKDGKEVKTFINSVGALKLLEVNLDLQDLVMNSPIKTADQWNQTMKFYAAQGNDVKVKVSKLTFTEAEPMTLPTNINVTVTSGDITFESGVQTIGQEFETSGNITVASGATLNLNADVTAKSLTNKGNTNVNAILTTDNFTNNMKTFIAADKGISGSTEANNFVNTGVIDCAGNIGGTHPIANTGIIKVTYGATVVNHDGKGTIEGVLDATTNAEIANNPVKAIWQMSMANTDYSQVKCNSLRLIGFNLTEGDTYKDWSGNSYAIALNSFAGINVQLVNSTLKINDENTDKTFEFHALNLEGSSVKGNVNLVGTFNAVEASSVIGNISANQVTVEESNVTGNLNATKMNIGLTKSTVSGNLTSKGTITLNESTVEGDAKGTNVTIEATSSIEGDVTATKNLTVNNSTVTGKLTVTEKLNITGSTVTAATESTSANITAENSTLVGEFTGNTSDVKLTNCTTGNTSVASKIETTGNLTITANGATSNVTYATLKANNVTFDGKNKVYFYATTLDAQGTCYVKTNAYLKSKKINGTTIESSMVASDYDYASGKTIEGNKTER